MGEFVGEHGGKLDDIEVLRGVAVLMVVVFHVRTVLLFGAPMPVWNYVSTHYFDLWSGVDLFFAISGFVIARSLLPKLRAAASDTDFFFEVLVFWIRRAWRLMPAAWLWLIIIFAITVVLPGTYQFSDVHTSFESTIAGMLGVANYRADRFFMRLPYGASMHYWTLSLEEQFYLALPVVVFFARRYLIYVMLAALVGFFIPSALGNYRLGNMIIGVLVAILSEQKIYPVLRPAALARYTWARRVVLGSGVGLIAAFSVLGQDITQHPLNFIALLGGALVFVASYGGNYLWAPGRSQRVMLWLGARSYGIYLAHFPIFCLIQYAYLVAPAPMGGLRHWRIIFWTAIGLALTFGASELVYRWVEQPMRDRGKRIAARQIRPAVPG